MHSKWAESAREETTPGRDQRFMPIDIETFETTSEERLRETDTTDTERVMRFLASHSDQAFTQNEICEGLGVEKGQLGVVLSHLQDSDLVRHKGDYWALGEDEAITAYSGLVESTRAANDRFGEEDIDEWLDHASPVREPPRRETDDERYQNGDYPGKSEFLPGGVPSRSHPLDTMLTISDVIQNHRYAAIYARVRELGTLTVEEIAEDLDSSKTAVDEDVNHLRAVGILERITDTQPHRFRATSIEMRVEHGSDTYQISPTLLIALARTESNENIRLYRDRNGVGGLATAVEYARDYVSSQTSARVMAREEEIPVLEAETILQELRDIVLSVEPELADEPDLEALDAAVDEPSSE